MKKYLFPAVLIIVGISLFFFMKNERIKPLQAADILPADVMFYVEQHDFVKVYKNFAASRLGKVLSRIDYLDIAVELDGDAALVRNALQLQQEIHTCINKPVFDQLFGKEFSLALFPMPVSSTKDLLKNIEERLLIIARPRHNAAIIQLLASFVVDDIEQKTVQYGRYTIVRYKIDEDYTLSTATVDGLLLAAVDERLVRKSLNVYDDQQNSLSKNPEFKQLRKNFEGAGLFKYFALAPVKKQGREMAEKLSPDARQQVQDFLEQWNGWEAGAYGAWAEDGLIEEKLEILYDAEKLDKNVAKFFTAVPKENTTLHMVPADSLCYYWGNSMNLPLLYKMYSDMVAAQRPGMFNLLEQELKDVAGMEIEDILALTANEWSLIVEKVEGEGVPIPRVLMLIELKDTVRFMEVFQKLLSETDIPIGSSSFQDHAISYWGLAPQNGLQPAYTLSGNYLLLSNSRDFVKQVLALQTNPTDTLINDPEITRLQNKLSGKNNSTAYVHIAHMADAFKTLVIWAGGMAGLQGPETAHKVNIILDEIVLPLLDGIGMYTQLASRTELKEKSIVMESSILVVD